MRSNVVATIDFDGVDAAESRRRCAPTGSSTPSRTASWVATSFGSPLYPAVDPSDAAKLTEAIDYVAERLS